MLFLVSYKVLPVDFHSSISQQNLHSLSAPFATRSHKSIVPKLQTVS